MHHRITKVVVGLTVLALMAPLAGRASSDPAYRLVSFFDLIRRPVKRRELPVKPSSVAVAGLYTDGGGHVQLVPQLGIFSASDQKQSGSVLVEAGPRLLFLDTDSVDISNDKAQKKVTVEPGKVEWLAMAPQPLKRGSLQRHPNYGFWLDRVAVMTEVSEQDLIRNEYLAAAFELHTPAAATGIYGPNWKGPAKHFVEFLKDQDFVAVSQKVDDAEATNEAYVCEGDSNVIPYGYTIYPDIDHRLEKASKRVVDAVVRHFVRRAKKNRIRLSDTEIAALFKVSSAYRNPARNRCVGGDPFSRHQWGLALDLSVQPDSTHAAEVAAQIGIDAGELWTEYRDVAARAVSSNSQITPGCKQGRLRAPETPQSRFSSYNVFCGCEGSGEFLNCNEDASLVDHVHIGF